MTLCGNPCPGEHFHCHAVHRGARIGHSKPIKPRDCPEETDSLLIITATDV